MVRNIRANRLLLAVFAIVALGGAACHREIAVPPMPVRNIRPTDKFFDVWPTSPLRAFIVGDRGKLLETDDGGKSFRKIDLGVDLGIFGIQLVDEQNGYLCGQDGLIMRTRDGGKSWQKINSRTNLFIFGLSFPDRLHGFFVGDQALVMSTTDGGETFTKRQLQRLFPAEVADYALPYAGPVLYGASFVDPMHGWVVGEFGRIWSTSNGGATWQEEQESLVDQWKRELGPQDDPRFRDFNLPTFFSVSFRDQKHGAACGLEGAIIQTDDGGATWHFVHQADKPGAPPDNAVPGASQIPVRDPLFSIDLFGSDQGMAVGGTGTALRLQPNSAWAHDPAFPTIPIWLSQVRFFDAMHGWVVGWGTILYTEDGGQTWRFCRG